MSNRREWSSERYRQGWVAFQKLRNEEFAALYAEFLQAAPHDFDDETVNQVVSGFPIEALQEWQRERTSNFAPLLVWEIFMRETTLAVTFLTARETLSPEDTREFAQKVEATKKWQIVVHAPNATAALARAQQLVLEQAHQDTP